MEAKQARKWKGMSDGVTTEWTLITKVKPGQEEAVRQFVNAMDQPDSPTITDVIIPVGTVHDYRTVVFDNGTRVLFTSNFDGDWGQYIDDFFATKVVAEGFDRLGSFSEGFPGKSASVDAKKAWFQAHTQQAVSYVRAYHGTVKEMWKAQALQKAFQEVLDHPDAAKALAHPALKPLLAHAAK